MLKGPPFSDPSALWLGSNLYLYIYTYIIYLLKKISSRRALAWIRFSIDICKQTFQFHTHMQWTIAPTSSILVAEIGEPPDIAQANAKAHLGEHVLQLTVPRWPAVLLPIGTCRPFFICRHQSRAWSILSRYAAIFINGQRHLLHLERTQHLTSQCYFSMIHVLIFQIRFYFLFSF